MKWIIFLTILYVFWRVYRGMRRNGAQDGNDNAARGASDRGDALRMLRCSYCGLNVPESEAFIENGKSFCSRPHADAGK